MVKLKGAHYSRHRRSGSEELHKERDEWLKSNGSATSRKMMAEKRPLVLGEQRIICDF